ncbi:hypothetical protein [Pseudomonas extremaustralis]
MKNNIFSKITEKPLHKIVSFFLVDEQGNSSTKKSNTEDQAAQEKRQKEEAELKALNEENLIFLKKKALRQFVKSSMPHTFQILADTHEDKTNLNVDFINGKKDMWEAGYYLHHDMFTDKKIENNVRECFELYQSHFGELRTKYVARHTRELICYGYLKDFTDRVYSSLEDQLIYNADKTNHFPFITVYEKYLPSLKPNGGNLFKKIYEEHKAKGEILTEKQIRFIIEEDIKSFEKTLVKYIADTVKKSPMLRTYHNENLKTDDVLKELYVNDMRDIPDEIILHELYKYHRYVREGKDSSPLSMLFTSSLSDFKIENRRLEIIQERKNKEIEEQKEMEKR